MCVLYTYKESDCVVCVLVSVQIELRGLHFTVSFLYFYLYEPNNKHTYVYLINQSNIDLYCTAARLGALYRQVSLLLLLNLSHYVDIS